MVLKMSRPTKHPTTGIYQLRKRVPQHLVPLVGKNIIKISLKTRDPQEAKIAHTRLLAEIESRWRQLSAGVISLSQKQAVAMAGEIYHAMISANENDPGSPDHRKAALIPDYLHLRPEKVQVVQLTKNDTLFERVLETYKVHRNDEAIQKYLSQHGYRVDEPSMALLQQAVATAVLQAKEHLLKMAQGDYRPDPDADRFPKLDMTSKKTKTGETGDLGKYSLVQVFEDYNAERQLSPASYKKWKGIIAKVAAEVPDIRDLTSDWVVDWKDRSLKSGKSAIHVKDSYLASLRAVCQWAKSNKRIPANPVDEITVSVPKATTTRDKWFTLEEATTILKGALEEPPERFSPEMKAARRWVPWLCAYTGARVGEITQLRKEDIQQHDGHWLIWITPDAGTTKNRNPRFVAIHPHLVEQGFIDFIRDQRKGPLFYDPGRHRGGTEGNPQYKKAGERLAAWVREIGVNDTRIQPNHAWRHLFKTEARGVFMDVGARDYMQGHVPASEGEAYGGYKPHVLAHEIAKFPRFELR
ncbi:hypothetical protein GCM10011491_34730 [Brucella endophytica]|uniref:DUF6538 domain-containing protein n=1 Tax=Brucella endophytica TaxID=1963359 RepID=A0A916SKG6_9HYPH|nr:DUF6538 domain-containing protein [Brucella endophytica]GGB03624.1 hypothetical protein GCM10011491_34730 [Brucella endophytica]